MLVENILLQPWTKVVETKVENPENSRYGSIFQIPNFPPYHSLSLLNLAQFCCKSLKLCEQH